MGAQVDLPLSWVIIKFGLKLLELEFFWFKLTWLTVKTRIKEHVFWGFRLILFLFIGYFLQKQTENVLKVFLKLFSKIKYCISYQQMKSMCKHNSLIN